MSQKGQEPPGILLDKNPPAWLPGASHFWHIACQALFLPISTRRLCCGRAIFSGPSEHITQFPDLSPNLCLPPWDSLLLQHVLSMSPVLDTKEAPGVLFKCGPSLHGSNSGWIGSSRLTNYTCWPLFLHPQKSCPPCRAWPSARSSMASSPVTPGHETSALSEATCLLYTYSF